MAKTPPIRQDHSYGRLVLSGDLVGTAVFAAEGCLIAVTAKLDLLGISVLAFVTALGGGIIRDLLLGSTPPAALRDSRYPLAVLVGMIIALLATYHSHKAFSSVLLLLDAAGLGFFTAAGTLGAIEQGSAAFAAVMLGTITATAGGALRDILLAEIPSVLRIGFYATAALIGASFTVVSRQFGVPLRIAVVDGGVGCVALRLLGVLLHWHLPVLHGFP